MDHYGPPPAARNAVLDWPDPVLDGASTGRKSARPQRSARTTGRSSTGTASARLRQQGTARLGTSRESTGRDTTGRTLSSRYDLSTGRSGASYESWSSRTGGSSVFDSVSARGPQPQRTGRSRQTAGRLTGRTTGRSSARTTSVELLRTKKERIEAQLAMLDKELSDSGFRVDSGRGPPRVQGSGRASGR